MRKRIVTAEREGRRAFRLALLALLLVAAACTLNPAPAGTTLTDGPPTVRLASPLPNATYLEGVPVNVQAYIGNAGPDIDRVEVAVDNSIVTTLPSPNASGGVVFSVTHSWAATGVGSHVISVTAFRGDGSSSQPATVTINVLGGVPEITQEAPSPIPATDTPDAEDQTDGDDDDDQDDGESDGGDDEDDGGNGGDDDDDDDGGEPTPSRPTATFSQGVNLRRGPGTNFNPPIGSYAAGQTAEIIAVNPARDWYKVRGTNGEGWVFASLVQVSGSMDNLPVDQGPPTPIPATPTPVPPTAPPATSAPQTSANLVAGDVRLHPSEPTCGETFEVTVDLANLGSSATTATGLFTVQDIHRASGTVVETTQGPIPIIEAGQTVESPRIPITVDAFFEEEHTLVVILNANGSIPETNASDNRREVVYTLRKGGC